MGGELEGPAIWDNVNLSNIGEVQPGAPAPLRAPSPGRTPARGEVYLSDGVKAHLCQ